MGRKVGRMSARIAILFLAAGCWDGFATETDRLEIVRGTSAGAAIDGLNPDERERFAAGHQLFRRNFTAEEGLGPLFNGDSCNACHTTPSDGGTGDQFLVRATGTHSDGSCDWLGGSGENIRQFATPLLQSHGIMREAIPADATAVSHINVPFLYGLGLVEAVPEETIVAREGDRGPYGELSGRAGRTSDGRLARFGRKANVATLFDFVEEALRLEMGLTTPFHPYDRGPGGDPFPEEVELVDGPEVDLEMIELLTDYIRYLAPLSRWSPSDPATASQVERGEALFESVGCAGCHLPYMDTATDAPEALAGKRIYLYSDLLLHDMGSELAGVCGQGAKSSEWRTEPLMGLGRRSAFLHDSRAGTLWEAIHFHGGEAKGARERFEALDRLSQEALIQFLRSL